MAMEMADPSSGGPAFGMGGLPLGGFDLGEASHGLGRETYASFLLLAVATFTLAGYLGLALFFLGALR